MGTQVFILQGQGRKGESENKLKKRSLATCEVICNLPDNHFMVIKQDIKQVTVSHDCIEFVPQFLEPMQLDTSDFSLVKRITLRR